MAPKIERYHVYNTGTIDTTTIFEDRPMGKETPFKITSSNEWILEFD